MPLSRKKRFAYALAYYWQISKKKIKKDLLKWDFANCKSIPFFMIFASKNCTIFERALYTDCNAIIAWYNIHQCSIRAGFLSARRGFKNFRAGTARANPDIYNIFVCT